MDSILYYLGFNRVSGIGPARLDKIITYCGSLESAWNASMSELSAAGLDSRSIESLVQARRTLELEAEYERVTAAGVRLISRDDPDYPPLLAQTTNPPFLLYVRGTLTELDRWSVAVVGTRQASTYGKEVTRKLVAGLVAAGITVVSGLALGIDAVAHSAALAAGGRTLAVLGRASIRSTRKRITSSGPRSCSRARCSRSIRLARCPRPRIFRRAIV